MQRKFTDVTQLKEDLRARVDLVDVVSRHGIELRQRGERWIGLCPFHEDNNPSFAVSPESIYEATESKGVWACWTCGAKGDLYGFVQRIHDATFFEAIQILVELVDFDLTPYYRELTAEEQLREAQYDAVGQIADLFVEQLLANKKKMSFFKQRGIEEDILRQLKVGYCPSLAFFNSSVDLSVRNFVEPSIPNRQLLFQGKIVYAQFTTSGNVWGWYARQPDDRPEGIPKYVGISAKASLFDGSDRLYGFPFARKLLRKSATPLILVEGFNDVLSAQQEGLPAVATCGTTLSNKQSETIATHSIRNAVVAYDPDEGGRDGSLQIANRAHKIPGVSLRFVDLDLEPEDYIRQKGVDLFIQEINAAKIPVAYIVSRYADFDISSTTRKKEFLDKIRPHLVAYPRLSLNRALGIQEVAQLTKLPEETVADYLDEFSDNPLVNLIGEMIVLAELAMSPEAWISLEVTEEHFSMRRYAHTFRLMRELYENEAEVNIDLLVTHAMNSRAPQEVIETISKLPTISRKTPEVFARDIKDKAIRRRAEDFSISLGNQVRDLRSPVGDSISGFIEGVTRAMRGTTSRFVFSSVEAVASTAREIEIKSAGDTAIAGLDLGPDWEWLTDRLNGLRPKRIIGIGAFSGVGKSVILMNWVHKISIHEVFAETASRPQIGAPLAAGLVATMEMTKEECIERLTAIDSGVPHSYIDHARFDAEEQVAMVSASLDRIRAARITWMEGQRTIREIGMQARLLQDKGELDYIAIDYIGLLDLSCYNDRWSVTEKYNQASWDLKVLAETLNIPIIFCAQMNRGAEDVDIPEGKHIGSAIKIYQDSHAFFILAKRDQGLIGSLDKNRRGGTGHVKLSFDRNEQTSTLRIRETEVLKR